MVLESRRFLGSFGRCRGHLRSGPTPPHHHRHHLHNSLFLVDFYRLNLCRLLRKNHNLHLQINLPPYGYEPGCNRHFVPSPSTPLYS